MFYGCTGMTSAPALPATTLTDQCYSSMFQGCTGLTSAPVLPATTLATQCYMSMFMGCTGLTSAPALPATTLANGCYGSMFNGCTKLTNAPALSATTLANGCYRYMFNGCTNLSEVTCYATARENTNNTFNWLRNVAASGTFYGPKNSVFASDAPGVSSIPEGWTFSPFQASLVTAPTARENLLCNGHPQALLNNDGVAEGGTLNYSLDNSTWSDAIPMVTDADNYTVYYKVIGDENHNDFTPASNSIAVTMKMQIFAKTITGKHITLEVTLSSLVSEVKQLIADKESLSTDMMRLIYGGHVMEDGRPLRDYNVIRDATIHVVMGNIISANEDPQNPSTYYSTFYDSSHRFIMPAGAEAYVATLSGDALILTKIAEEGEVLPENTAVIIKAEDASLTMVVTTEEAVTFTATNNLHGVDEPTAAPANCYVLSGHSSDNSVTGVGFYQYTGTLKAHKAYAVFGGGSSMAPKKLRFVFNATTDVESIQPSEVRSQKVLRNGQLIIIRNGVEYNAAGQIVK